MGIFNWFNKNKKRTSTQQQKPNSINMYIVNDYKTDTPTHNISNYNLNSETEHFLEMIKIDFDSRYSPEDYCINYELMPSKKDKEDVRIVLLWWLNKFDIHEKFPPSYFYFKYGLYIDEEIRYLNEINWLNNFSLTPTGKKTLEQNSEIIDKHRNINRREQYIIDTLADNFVIEEFDINSIELNIITDENTDFQFDAGNKYLKIAETLTKNKEYEKSLNAIIKAWSIGYQVPATWIRAAINARYLKNRKLEESILLMGIKWATLSNISTKRFDDRLKRVHELMAKEQTKIKTV